MTCRRALPRLVTTALVVSLTPVITPGLAAERSILASAVSSPLTAPLTEPQDAVTAMSLARARGVRVEVVGQRTETRSVFAEPQGTMTAELSVRPVRVKRGGTWVAMDTTLERHADGNVGPRVAAAELSFPGGGAAGSAIRYGRLGKWVELSWPRRLPSPVLEGSTATYPGVMPGVDLVLRADADGFAQFLVVKNAVAARNPALWKVRLGLRTGGVSLRATSAGALEARGSDGAVVFAAEPSQMWDSGETARRQAAVGVAVDAESVWLRPDRELLTDRATAFPVTIDPVWRTVWPYAWTKVFSGKATTSYYNGCCDDDSWAKVGQCYVGGNPCNGIGEAWSYFQFDTQFLGGKRILDATVTAKLVYSPSSYAKYHRLFLANDAIGPSTTWNNRPAGVHLSNSSVPCAGRSGCAAAVDVPFWAGTFVRAGGISTYYLRAMDGADQLAWRKYDAWATRLTIHYNTVPNLPSGLTTDPPLPAACAWCAGRRYVGDSGIRLRARLSDPDGDQVRPYWRVYYNGALQPEAEGLYKSSGEIHDYFVDLTNRHGQTVWWEMYANDGADNNGYAFGTAFTVDRVAPSTRPNVSGVLYREDNRWHGGVGVPDTFTFDSAGIDDVDHFLYGWQNPPTTKVDADALGGKAVVSLAPPGDGPRDLFVQSVDRAGHRSPMRVFRFYVRAGSGPLAQWSYEGSAADDAFLGDRDGTLNGGASYGPGAVGSALQFDPAGHMSAPNTVRTDTSFSVSAWVRPDAVPTNVHAVLSQDGQIASGFYLNYRGALNRWVFSLVSEDRIDPIDYAAVAPDVPQVRRWTHLAGVFDRPENRIRLYVNGMLKAERALPADFVPWHAGGAFVAGREKFNGQTGNRGRGAIDEVQAYDRVLSPSEIAAMVGRDNVQVGYWKFDELNGTTAGNAVDGGDMAVLRGGASFTGDSNADGMSDGGAVGGAVRLDGADDAVSVPHAVDVRESFAVAAWVQLDARGGVRTVASEDGLRVSAFKLRAKDGRWSFVMFDQDVDYGGGGAEVFGGAAEVGVWTHLVASYDAAADRISLHVNGVLTGAANHSHSWDHAAGELLIGRAKWNGQTVEYLPGTVDEVRAYSRVLSVPEIQGLVSRDHVALGQWRLDGNADDVSGNDRHGTPSGGPAWADGQSARPDPTDLAVRLDGIDDSVGVPHTVDVRQSFAVTAWAWLDAGGGLRTVASQDGSRVSAFKLRATSDGRWSFVMFDQDADGGGGRAEVFGGAAQVGVWTHLVASYDAAANRLSLHVNGVLAGAAAHSHAWNYAAGALQIGRARWNGVSVEYFPGAVDDLAVYGRVLFSEEIRVIAGRDLLLAHNWTLDEQSGSTAADAVGSRSGTLAGGVSRVPGRSGMAAEFDGVDDKVSTTGVDVRTDASFSVSAWVFLSRTCDPGSEWSCELVAVSVDGASTSKFRLGHVADQDQFQEGVWVFEMPEQDGAVTKAAVSVLPSDFNCWVHLAGVYDKSSNKLWLYVNGTRKGDGTLLTPWHATGGLQIGRGKDAAGFAGQYFAGRIDDVRLYSGRLDDDRINNLYRSYPAQVCTSNVPTAGAGYWTFDENTEGSAGGSAAGAEGRVLKPSQSVSAAGTYRKQGAAR